MDLLKGKDPDELTEWLGKAPFEGGAECTLREFKPGERIITEGSFGNSFFILIRGSVNATLGPEALRLATLAKGSFFGEMTAGFIGWKNSPFQEEVGFASLGYAVVGFLAFRRSFDLRLAAVTGPSLFLFCAGAGHVYQIITTHNFAPGNSGVILYMDFLLPVIGFVLLWLQHRCEQRARA